MLAHKSRRRATRRQRWGAWLLEPSPGITDDELRQNAELLSGLLLGLTAMLLTVTLYFWAISSVYVLLFAEVTLFLLVTYGISRTRRYYLAAILTIITLTVPTVAGLLSETDMTEASIRALLMWLIFPVIVGSVLFSMRGLVILTVIALVAICVMPLLIPGLPFRSVVGAFGFTFTLSMFMIAFLHHRQRLERSRQAQLRESERRYRALFEHNNDAVFLLGLDGAPIAVNETAAGIFGYSAAELLGIPLDQIVLSEEYSDSLSRLETLLAGKSLPVYERQMRHKDGHIISFEVNAALVRDQDGTPMHIQSIMRDISERKQREALLQESRARYRNFVEHSIEGIWMLAFDEPIPTSLPAEEQVRRIQTQGYVAECNDVLARMYGYGSSRDLLGKRLLDLYGGVPNLQNTQATLKLVTSNYQSGGRETREINSAGETVYFENSAVGIIEDDHLVALWGTQRDISERKRAETALARHVREVDALNQVLRDVAELQDLDTLLQRITASAVSLVGRENGGMAVYRPDHDMLEWVVDLERVSTPDDSAMQRPVGLLGKVWQTRQPQIVADYSAWSEKIPEQADFKASAVGVPIQWGEGVLGVLVVVDETLTPFDEHDLEILNRFADQSAIAIQNAHLYAQAQQEIAERQRSERLLRLVFEYAFDGISIYEEFEDGRPRKLVDCNARYAEIAGRSREDLLRQGDNLPLQTLFEHKATGELEGNLTYQGRYSWLRPDGRENIVEYAAVRVNLQNRLLVIGVDRDITAQVQASQEREALIAELEAKNAELERFTYTVSHDLKSPLITIAGFLGFLRNDVAAGDNERIENDIASISLAAKRMQQLLNELLELSRIGRLVNPAQDVAMSALAGEAAGAVAGQVAARGVQVDIAVDMPVVRGDRVRLREVYENLISNATKFMGDQSHPRIEVGVSRRETQDQGTEPVFFVRDNGIGIAPQYHEKVFDLFEKLDSQTEGTGIGLAIVKRIVETHGGRIWVESDGVGHGSTFCFILPGKASLV